VRSLASALPKISAFPWTRKCANQDCRRSRIRSAGWRKAAGITVQDQWLCGPDCFEESLAKLLATLNVSARRELPAHRNRVPLGLTLLARGHLSEPQLRTALDEHHATGVRLGDVILQLGFATEQQVTSALAEQWGYPIFSLRNPVSETPVSIPTRLLELNRMLPVYYASVSRRLLVGFADGVNYRILDAIAHVVPCAPSPCIIAASEYRSGLEFIVARMRGKEVAFDGESTPWEMARIIRNYAVQTAAEEMRFAACGNHLWTRLKGRRQEMDILFRLSHE